MYSIKNTAIDKLKKLFATGFFHIFGGNVINKIIVFLSGVILVRILTKEEYGTFTYAWNIYGIVILFNGLGLESSMLQLSSERGGEEEYTHSVSAYCLWIGLVFNILLCAALILLGLFAPLKIGGGRRILCALCLLPLLQFVFSMITCYLRSQKRNQEYASLSVINSAMSFAVSVVACLLLREMGLVVGHYFATLAGILVGLLFYHVRIFGRSTIDLGEDRRMLLKIGVISMINNGMSQLMYLLDLFVLGIVDPQETILASYRIATMIPTALTFIPGSLMIYVYPYFAEHREDGAWCMHRYKQILIALGGFNLAISTILIVGAPLVIRLVFGSNYLDAVPVFRLLSINYFISGTFRIISGNLLVSQRQLKFNLLVAIVSSVTNSLADYFFIRWWGAMGAAYATILVVLLFSVMSTAYLIYSFKTAGNNGNSPAQSA